MTQLYIYRLTSDTGLAPCIKDGWLSLACCKGGQISNRGKIIKTGIRYWIGSKRDGIDYTVDKVYVLGIYHNKFLYLARITDVVTMTDYYDRMSKGRTDDIYSLENGNLVRNDNLRKEEVHTDEKQNKRDIAGTYVLLSDEYVYLGKNSISIDIVNKYASKARRQKPLYDDIAEQIVKECLKYRDDKEHLPNEPFKKKCQCSSDKKGKVYK